MGILIKDKRYDKIEKKWRFCMKKTKRNFWIIWLIVTAASFLLLFAGVKLLLGNPVTSQNILAYFILSFIFGVVAATLYLLNRKSACILFIIGLAVGFFEMSRMFLSDMSGWGDLIGLMSLLIWSGIGLGAGITAELVQFVYKKINSHKDDS
jgi:hypothetical protein